MEEGVGCLPRELWLHILTFVPVKSILHDVAILNHYWHELTEESILWHNLYKKLTEQHATSSDDLCQGDWKSNYRNAAGLTWNPKRCGPLVSLDSLRKKATNIDNSRAGWKGGVACASRGFTSGNHFWRFGIDGEKGYVLVMMGLVKGDACDVTIGSFYNTEDAVFLYSYGIGIYGNGWSFSFAPNTADLPPMKSELDSSDIVGCYLTFPTPDKPLLHFFVNDIWVGSTYVKNYTEGTPLYPAVELGLQQSAATLLSYAQVLPENLLEKIKHIKTD